MGELAAMGDTDHSCTACNTFKWNSKTRYFSGMSIHA